jgi:hypothetical protein
MQNTGILWNNKVKLLNIHTTEEGINQPTNQPTNWSRVLLQKQIVIQIIKNPQLFMEHEDSLPYKSLPLVSVLIQMHPVNIFPPHFPKIHSKYEVLCSIS